MTTDELNAAFLKTPEMIEHRKTIGAILNRLDPEDTETVCLQIPKQFLAMLDFTERHDAAAAGRVAAPADQVLNQIVVNELHDQLHWLTVAPARFAYYRNLWNRFCDLHGAADQKIPDPLAPTQQGGEGPF